MKKLICGLFAALMILNTGVWAVPEVDEQTEQRTQTNLQEEEAEKKAEKKEEKPTVDSQGRPILADREAAILIEGSTGVVLFEKDSKKRMYPASTTKIMTALIATEKIERNELNMSDTVEITAEMLSGLDPDGTNIALKEGEIMTVENLLRGLMIASGNDAAMALAYKISGGIDGFCQLMNDKAALLGLEETHFVNPHGLHDENHYTTASDLAKISAEAMKHEIFRDIVDIAHVKMPPTNKTEKERYYINTNGLLSTMRYLDYYYKGTTGIKTGTTDAAGSCLVSSVKRGGMELICVLLNGEKTSDSHKDSIRLFDYGFENFEYIRAVAEDEIVGQTAVKWGWSKDTVTLSAVNDINVVVPKGTEVDKLEIRLNLPENVYAPVKEGDVLCTASVILEDKELGGGAVSADTDVSRSFFWPVMAVGEWLWSMLLVRIIIYLGIIALIWLAIVVAVGFTREYKKAEKQKNYVQKTGRKKNKKQ